MTAFPANYFAARDAFRAAVSRLGWPRESHAIPARGPAGEELTLDVAAAPGPGDKLLVLSAGLHGVEGYFGSAVLAAQLERWAKSRPGVRCLLLHGLNPYGFAFDRRADETNTDPGRNFLPPGEAFAGSPPGYAAFDHLLNPPRPPSRWEPFILKAGFAILRHGLPATKEAVATGQYDFPKGLFFGGAGPSAVRHILATHFDRWLAAATDVLHLDFHTGLGEYGVGKLLIDTPQAAENRDRLRDAFGADGFEENDSTGVAYTARGGFGPWCVARRPGTRYQFACAEFGTFGPVRVLGALRAENRAHHWGDAAAAGTARAKQDLRECFAPAAAGWRESVLTGAGEMIDVGTRMLAGK